LFTVPAGKITVRAIHPIRAFLVDKTCQRSCEHNALFHGRPGCLKITTDGIIQEETFTLIWQLHSQGDQIFFHLALLSQPIGHDGIKDDFSISRFHLQGQINT